MSPTEFINTKNNKEMSDSNSSSIMSPRKEASQDKENAAPILRNRKTTTSNFKYINKSSLIRANKHMAELILVLKDELLAKDQQIRYMKVYMQRFGIFERGVLYLKNFFVRIKLTIKKIIRR